MKSTYTIVLKDKTFPLLDITNVHFNIKDMTFATLDITTSSNGDFHFDCLVSETEKFKNLVAMKSNIINTLSSIARGDNPSL